jgi:uncharacterized BrkB/YihY/UPF0761 family membrane protein
VLGELGESSVWHKQISPGMAKRLPHPTFAAVNYAADRILAHATAGLLVFAFAATIWELSGWCGLGVAIELLVRFAPAERRPKKWVTLGSIFTVASWVVASLIFRWWATSVASFRSTWGTFVAVLVLTGYLYTSSIVFLVGVQADELVRKDTRPHERGLFDRVRAAIG